MPCIPGCSYYVEEIIDRKKIWGPGSQGITRISFYNREGDLLRSLEYPSTDDFWKYNYEWKDRLVDRFNSWGGIQVAHIVCTRDEWLLVNKNSKRIAGCERIPGDHKWDQATLINHFESVPYYRVRIDFESLRKRVVPIVKSFLTR